VRERGDRKKGNEKDAEVYCDCVQSKVKVSRKKKKNYGLENSCQKIYV